MSGADAADPVRARVAALGGFMAYFETIMEPGFRDDRRGHLAAVAGPLERRHDVRALGLLADPDDAGRLERALCEAGADVLLVVPTMASPPGPIVEIALRARLPVVIANAHGLERIDAGYDMGELCRHSTNVGTTMVASLLKRRGVTPAIVTGFLGDADFHERLSAAVAAAAVASRLAGLRVGRLGLPMPGYDHVGLDAAEAADCGVEVVDVPLPAWARLVADVTAAEIRAFLGERLPPLLPANAEVAAGTDLERAARLAVALDRAMDAFGLDCASLTCRGPFGVGLEDGAVGCLATSLSTSLGRPASATGDLLTAIAMWIARKLSGAALYCELDAIDRPRGAFLVANTGEGDFAWCPPDGAVEIVPAAAHSGREVPGVVLRHDLAEGPATFVGFTLDRTRARAPTLIALEGATLARPHTGLKVTNGLFRTDRAPEAAFAAWADAGATHHGALSPGRLGEALSILAALRDLSMTRI